MTKKIRFTSFQTIAIGFALLIIIGAEILSLPISSRDGNGIPFFDALFTSTSATCVTGLVLFDTFTKFSFFGQLIIIILIQVGGLGFMAVAILLQIITRRKIGLRERSLMMESLSSWQIGGVVRVTKKALKFTAFFEIFGAVILTIRFSSVFSIGTSIWYGIFHSVSAFCNAGFDLMGRLSPNSSLTLFVTDPVVNFTIMSLIICGGLGFFVWYDISEKKYHFSKYRLHTKIMLIATAVLIIFGAAFFYYFERNNTLSGMTVGQKIMASLFQSVTPRTAGYNTVDMGALTEGGALSTMVLMFIGAGPGSTGGGLKVTTFFVIALLIVSRIRNSEEINIFKRRIEDDATKKAATSFGIYVFMSIVATFILCAQGFTIKAGLFEVLSALGTVGLTTGITSSLPVISRSIIILLMYAGRVGTISVAMALAERREKVQIKNTVEKIIIG